MNEYKTSEAKRRNNAKYDKAHMAFIGIKVPKAERELFELTAQAANKPLARYIRDCVKYCIDNGIDITDS